MTGTVNGLGSLFSGSDVTWSGGLADEWPGTQPANCATEAADSPTAETQADDHTRDFGYIQGGSVAQTTQTYSELGAVGANIRLCAYHQFQELPVNKDKGWCVTRA